MIIKYWGSVGDGVTTNSRIISPQRIENVEFELRLLQIDNYTADATKHIEPFEPLEPFEQNPLKRNVPLRRHC
jgi:hypothetical protein